MDRKHKDWLDRYIKENHPEYSGQIDAIARKLTKKMTKDDLRKIYRQWAKDEIEAIDLIEAVGKYVGG